MGYEHGSIALATPGLPLRLQRAYGLIAAVFGNGLYPGFYYDFTSLTKVGGLDPLYTTSTGETAVTASGDLVGLALDRSQGAVRGSELRPSGAASLSNNTGTGTSSDDGTTISLAGSDGSNRGRLGWPITVELGAFYEVTYEILTLTGPGTILLGIASSWTTSGIGPAPTAPGVYRAIYIGAVNGARVLSLTSSSSSVSATVSNSSVSIKKIAGNHAYQATSGSRGAWNSGGYWLGDGTDDNLLGVLLPTAAFSMVACSRVGTASRTIMGSKTAGSDEISIGLSADGYAQAILGAATLVGSVDLRGADHLIGLRKNASLAELWVDGALVDSDTPGTVNTIIPLRIGARNNNGTADQFQDGRNMRDGAVQRFVPDSLWLPWQRYLARPNAGFAGVSF